MNPDRTTADSPSLPPAGAHIVTPRNGYEHHGIYVGNGRVVHYAGLCRTMHAGPVEEVSLSKFEAGNGWRVAKTSVKRFTSEQAIARARSRVGENHYHLIHNNCEHFCTWSTSGDAVSWQVSRYTKLVDSLLGVVSMAFLVSSLVIVA